MVRFDGPYTIYQDEDWDDKFFLPESMGMVVPTHNQAGDKFILFRCPCGITDTCGNIMLPINRAPNWAVEIDINGLVTISPSIQQVGDPGCKSHFFIKNGMVQWC